MNGGGVMGGLMYIHQSTYQSSYMRKFSVIGHRVDVQ